MSDGRDDAVSVEPDCNGAISFWHKGTEMLALECTHDGRFNVRTNLPMTDAAEVFVRALEAHLPRLQLAVIRSPSGRQH
jgi:hypothetical protein